MIGGNNLRVGFNGPMQFITCFMELITSQPRIFSQMRKHYTEMSCAVSLYTFSQMNNLVGLHKILVCENHR